MLMHDVQRAAVLTQEESPFLRIPPFPGAKVRQFETSPSKKCDPDLIVAALREARVGGVFWGATPPLPRGAILVRSISHVEQARQLNPGSRVIVWSDEHSIGAGPDTIVHGDADPWQMLDGAHALICDATDPVGLVAACIGVAIYVIRNDGEIVLDQRPATEWIENSISPGTGFKCPFTGETLTAIEAIKLTGLWRRQIDANRSIVAAHGFAFWKKESVAPLLWGGSSPVNFASSIRDGGEKGEVAIWRARTDPGVIAALATAGRTIVEVEDGFLRSRGLGADCVPPLSIVVDRRGPHYDPARPSELEILLQDGKFDEDVLRRAAFLRNRIVEAGLGKYEAGGAPVGRFAPNRRHLLVPGQVEDDQSVLTGGGSLTNLEVLKRVRSANPNAYIIYKPHPDVVAGHREGASPDQQALNYADRVVTNLPISALLEMVDEVHVNTSLTGFEALLRGKPVTTLGVPFYAGWGLTTDLGPIPARRSARRSLDELVAAALILYPRYWDPITGLPCPAEVAVDRLICGNPSRHNVLVGLRRLQGRVAKRLKSMNR